EDAVHLLAVLNQLRKRTVNTVIGGTGDTLGLGGLVNKRTERGIRTCKNRRVERERDCLSDLGTHRAQVVTGVGTDDLSGRSEDRSDLVRLDRLHRHITLGDRLLLTFTDPRRRNI